MSRRVAASPRCPTTAPRLAVVVIWCWCPAPWRALVPNKQQNSPATSPVPPRGHPAAHRTAACLPVHPCRAGGYTSVPMLGGQFPCQISPLHHFYIKMPASNACSSFLEQPRCVRGPGTPRCAWSRGMLALPAPAPSVPGGSQSISFQFKLLQKKHEESTPRRGTALTEGGDGKELRGSLRRAQHVTWSLFRGVTGKITLSSRVAGV